MLNWNVQNENKFNNLGPDGKTGSNNKLLERSWQGETYFKKPHRKAWTCCGFSSYHIHLICVPFPGNIYKWATIGLPAKRNSMAICWCTDSGLMLYADWVLCVCKQQRLLQRLVGAFVARQCTYSKGRLLYETQFSTITPLFKIGTSLKVKNLLPEGANSFLLKQFLMVWKITLTTLGDPLEYCYFYYARA